MSLQRIAVFCGSGSGNGTTFVNVARRLGQTLARRGIGVVYGGAHIGLMGAVADGALESGGEVIGVIPGFLRSKEIAHTGLTELIEVESMHARKLRMHERCDGVIALPGGFGTLEELFEVLTWGQLGLHRKPVGLLNVSGYYDALVTLLTTMTGEGFLRPENRKLLLVENNLELLLDKMETYRPPMLKEWVSVEKT